MKRAIAFFSLICFSLAQILHASDSGAREADDNGLPLSREALGNLWDFSVTESFVVLDDTSVEDRVRAIVATLAASPAKENADYRVGVINDSAPLSFSLPPNRIYVSTGLLDVLTTQTDLAAALALQLAYLTENTEYEAFTTDLAKRNQADTFALVVTLGAFVASLAGGYAFALGHAGEGAAAAQSSSWSQVWSHALEVQLPLGLIYGGGAGVGLAASRIAEEAGQRLPSRDAFFNRLAPLLGKRIVSNVNEAAIFSLFQAAYFGYEADPELRSLARAASYLETSGYNATDLIVVLKKLLLVRKEYLSKGYISALFLAAPGLEKRIEYLATITTSPN